LLIVARAPDGSEVEYEIDRPEGVPMGLELEPPSIRRCANRCDFCFVDGLPTTTRKSLDIRDDDYRLSFRHGNFATLTNLKQNDIDRIIEYHLSPLYVSVHATDPVVRRRLLRNPLAPDVLEQMKSFAEHRIEFHTQIVLQPDVNDGSHLEQSLSDLWDLGESVLSVSVVPVALTEFSRHDLSRQPTGEECSSVIRSVASWQARAREKKGFGWVYGSDDLYINAGEPLPAADEYDGFEQVENGVGSVRFLQEQINEMPSSADLSGKKIGVFSGKAMERLMPGVLETLTRQTGGTFESVHLENSLFGSSVTTAALLPGSAFRDALADRPDLDLALLPAEAINDDGLFMDDLKASELEAIAPMEVKFSYCFSDVLGGEGQQ
jgi:putative radical SAM enzyme (TIGR03279 family)